GGGGGGGGGGGPVGGGGGPVGGGGGGGGTNSPLVTVSSVQEGIKRHKVTEVLITFTGDVNAAEAQNLAEYSLVMAGKHRAFTARNAKKRRPRTASYTPAPPTVTLIPRKAFARTKKVEPQVNGPPPSGLQDTSGRSIAGNLKAVLSGGGVTMARSASAGNTA